jgi:short subunit dehydrogenase-like uncharacterized protein
MTDRPLDLVVLGATGFTGRQAAAYVHEHGPAGLRWAVAGRRAEALEAVAAACGGPAVRVVDTADADAVAALARETRVLLTTVGPYARYGAAVVAACARHGTDYVDITGETPWVREMIDAHQAEALASGARLVPLCGFDSVPSDLGAMLVARHCNDALGQPCGPVVGAFSGKGGFNGGTLESAMGFADRGVRRRLADPFLLHPADAPPPPDRAAHRDPTRPVWSEEHRAWLAPFFMGPVNTRVVRRSAALFAARGAAYGPDFAYQEYLRGPSRLAAYGVTVASGAVLGLTSSRLGRAALRRLGPKPGEGPSEATMDGGYVKARFVGRAADGAVVRARVEGPGDPGNRFTVRAMVEAALLLAPRRADLPDAAGFLTPATAFGAHLVEALRARGMTIEVAVEE